MEDTILTEKQFSAALQLVDKYENTIHNDKTSQTLINNLSIKKIIDIFDLKQYFYSQFIPEFKNYLENISEQRIAAQSKKFNKLYQTIILQTIKISQNEDEEKIKNMIIELTKTSIESRKIIVEGIQSIANIAASKAVEIERVKLQEDLSNPKSKTSKSFSKIIRNQIKHDHKIQFLKKVLLKIIKYAVIAISIYCAGLWIKNYIDRQYIQPVNQKIQSVMKTVDDIKSKATTAKNFVKDTNDALVDQHKKMTDSLGQTMYNGYTTVKNWFK